jgi:hypothetical protein
MQSDCIAQFFKKSQKIGRILNILSCDLSSELIKEFPALRGLMAHEYIIRNKIYLPGKYFRGVVNNNLYWGESELYEKFIFPFSNFEKIYIFGKNFLKARHFIIHKKEPVTSSRDPFQIRRTLNNAFFFMIEDISKGDFSMFADPDIDNEKLFFSEEDFKSPEFVIFEQKALHAIYKNISDIDMKTKDNAKKNAMKQFFDSHVKNNKITWSVAGLLDFLKPIANYHQAS